MGSCPDSRRYAGRPFADFLPHAVPKAKAVRRVKPPIICYKRPMCLHDYAPRPAHIKWILNSDAAIRWQVMRDLADEDPDTIAAERSRVATEGWGAKLLSLQSPAGHWGGPHSESRNHRSTLAKRQLHPPSNSSCDVNVRPADYRRVAQLVPERSAEPVSTRSVGSSSAAINARTAPLPASEVDPNCMKVILNEKGQGQCQVKGTSRSRALVGHIEGEFAT